MFSESTLKKVAMRFFNFTLAELKNLRANNTQDVTLFNIELLMSIRNRFPERKVILIQMHSKKHDHPAGTSVISS